MFQYNKYMADLVNRRREASQQMAAGESGERMLTIDDPEFEGVLVAAAGVSNRASINDS